MAADPDVPALEPERQAALIEAEERSRSPNLFARLNLQPGASEADVAQAFRDASRKFHPDKYYGRALGPLKAVVEATFRRLVEANNVLTNAEQRRAYLDKNPQFKGKGAPVQVGSTDAETERRAVERRERLSKHPYFGRPSLIQGIGTSPSGVRSSGGTGAQPGTAGARPSTVEGAPSKMTAADMRERAEFLYARAEGALLDGAVPRALDDFREATKYGHSMAAYKAAAMLEASQGNPKEIASLIRVALDNEPNNVLYRLLLARTLESTGLKARAQFEYREILRIDARNGEAISGIRRLQ